MSRSARRLRRETRDIALRQYLQGRAGFQAHPQEDNRDDDGEWQDEASSDLVERCVDLESAPDGKRRNAAYILQAVVIEAAHQRPCPRGMLKLTSDR